MLQASLYAKNLPMIQPTNNNQPYDLVALGNAIVDILTYKDEAFLHQHGLPKGSMQLIDETRSSQLYTLMGASTECSGGSAGNTLAGYCMLGGKGAFIGKVKADQFGTIFRKDLEHSGAYFAATPATSGEPTAKCLIFVTEEEQPFGVPPKIERTMATYLGISGKLNKEDINGALISQAKVLYFEGYLWDSPSAREAITYAISIAKEYKVKVAFTLSDPFCVDRHRADFLKLAENDIDILMSNEREACALYQEQDVRRVLHHMQGLCELAAVTRSEKGSVLLHQGEAHMIDPVRVEHVYDVTGAGDLYAAGLLYGYINGYPIRQCGQLAGLCAAEVIKYLGGRPVTKLSDLLAQLNG